MFCLGSIVTLIMVPIWTHIAHVPLATVIVINVILFAGIFSRMIPAQALISAIPEPAKRGSFNAVSASLQQFAGGVSASVAGWLIVQRPNGSLAPFFWLGYVWLVFTLGTFVFCVL